MAVQNIRIKYLVDKTEVLQADKAIDNLTDSEKKLKEEFDKANKSADQSFKTIKDGSNGLNGTLKTLGGLVAGTFAVEKVIAFGTKVIEVRGEFQKLEAVLTNTLGSNSAAQRAISDITNFAAKTNFGVVELTNSFVKLANRGFTPTINELENLADLANSTGKSFDQLTEAILDAQTGEFERLKEFGVRASKEGDNVKFAFKGVQTQVKFTSDAIKEYLVGLGDLNGVQGSTAAISQTLVGQMSNLGDSMDALFNTIGMGNDGVLTDFISLLNDSINLVNKLAKTAAQAGKEQASVIEAAYAETAKAQVNNQLEFAFLMDKNAEYSKAFIEARTEEQEADFRAFAEITENRKRASQASIADLTTQLENYRNVMAGYSIAETLAYRKKLEAQLKAQQDFYAALLEAEKKAQEKPKDQKALDDEYKKELARLKEREQNTLREAKVAEMSKVYLLDVERNYNVERVALFKKYNQQNLEELRGYNIRFKELDKETKEARMQNNVDYAKIESQKVDISRGTDKLIKDINLSTAEANIKQYNEDVAAFKRAQEKKREFAQTFVFGLVDLYNMYQQNQQAQTQIEIQANNEARQQELKNYGDNKQAQAAINARYDKQERKLKNEQAQRDKETAIFNAFVSTAAAVAKALPNIPLSVLAGALGAAQIAIISSRPVPKYAKGVERLEGEGTETSDSILAMLSKGERVVTAKENRDYFPALHAIHNRHIPPELLNNMVMNYDRVQPTSSQVFINDNSAVASKLDKVVQKLDNIKQVNVNIDKNGIHAFMETEYRREEFVNNYITK